MCIFLLSHLPSIITQFVSSAIDGHFMSFLKKCHLDCWSDTSLQKRFCPFVVCVSWVSDDALFEKITDIENDNTGYNWRNRWTDTRHRPNGSTVDGRGRFGISPNQICQCVYDGVCLCVCVYLHVLHVVTENYKCSLTLLPCSEAKHTSAWAEKFSSETDQISNDY